MASYPPAPFLRYVLSHANETVPNTYLGDNVLDHQLPPEFVAMVQHMLRDGALEATGPRRYGADIPSRVAVTTLGRQQHLSPSGEVPTPPSMTSTDRDPVAESSPSWTVPGRAGAVSGRS